MIVKIGPADPDILLLRANSLVRNKIGCHGNDPWDIEKNIRSIIYTKNAFIWYKIASDESTQYLMYGNA